MDPKAEFNYTDGQHHIAASFRLTADSTMSHLVIDITSVDKPGETPQHLEIDSVLDNQFHMVLAGLTPEQADAFTLSLLNGGVKKVNRRLESSLGPDGVLVNKRDIDIPGQPFQLIFKALVAAIPALATMASGLEKVDNPIWQEAFFQKNPFFGSNEHHAQMMAGKKGIRFDFEKISIWVANKGPNPEYFVLIKTEIEALRFATKFPANQGGGTMHVHSDRHIFEFGQAASASAGANSFSNIERTVAKLCELGFLSPSEAERFATHQSVLGKSGRRIDMSRLVGQLQAARAAR